MPLLASDPHRIGRPPGEPSPDRAPDALAAGTPEPLRSELIALLGADRVLTRAFDIVRYASDASPYRLFPKAIVIAHDEQDISKLFSYSKRTGIPLTFRSGGTSLNGQGQTEGILVDVRREWSGVQVEDEGKTARVKPGTVLGLANRMLQRHGYKLGPDPASTDAATIGGVIANNSGGMRCGTKYDSYQTVRSLTFVLPSGTVIDTAAPGAEEEFARLEPELAEGLLVLRDELRGNPELAERVRRKFSIKNTMGYRLCAFLDADTPLEIFRRLLIGSEGTLAFTAEAVFETRPQPKLTSVSWLHFGSIGETVAPVPELVAIGARAVEVMAAPALVAAAHMMPGTPEYWKELPIDSAALLVEFGGETEAELLEQEATAQRLLSDHELLHAPAFTHDQKEIGLAWHVREGLFGLVGQMRPPRSALIIEDVCVEPARIAECAVEIQALLGKYAFLTGVAGHASAGNLHFQLTPEFHKPEDIERYENFMAELVELIVSKYDGSLKAEHGTGINMAPWVEREWGSEATEIMWRIKALADPDSVLNPGVVLNRDDGVHLRNLKVQPTIEEIADRCVECGLCEPVCPSRNATTTPRQRIVVRREMSRQEEGSPVYEALMSEYEYEAIQTCAADGSCAPVCPVAIDTGKLMKRFREREHTAREESVALKLAKRWSRVERAARSGLKAGKLAERVLGKRAVAGVPRALRRRVSEDILPTWPTNMPPAAPTKLPASSNKTYAAAVYLPACINRIFGNATDSEHTATLPETLVELSRCGKLPLWIPDDVAGTCCGTPWASKGYDAGHKFMAQKTAESLLRWTDDGKKPVVIDATSCSQGLLQDIAPQLDETLRKRFEKIEILDSIEWVHDRLLPQLEIKQKVDSVAVHPTCAAQQLDLSSKLESLAASLATDVIVPASATCCGMAGDRGLLHPELPASAIRDEAKELENEQLDGCLCSNRTCEIGLQQNTGRPYESFVFLLEKLTR